VNVISGSKQGVVLVACVCVMLFLTMFVSLFLARLQEHSCSHRCETSEIFVYWLCDHAIKYARWQHHATGRVVRFAVPDAAC